METSAIEKSRQFGRNGRVESGRIREGVDSYNLVSLHGSTLRQRESASIVYIAGAGSPTNVT